MDSIAYHEREGCMAAGLCMICNEEKETSVVFFCEGDSICADCFEKETGVPAHPSHINKGGNRKIVHNAVEEAKNARAMLDTNGQVSTIDIPSDPSSVNPVGGSIGGRGSGEEA